MWNVWMEKGEPGEGRGNPSEEGLSLPPDPPPFPRLSTDGEAARREFVPMRVRKNKFLRVDWNNAFPHAR